MNDQDVRNLSDDELYELFEKTYRAAAKKVHPDFKHNQTPEEQAKATRLMQYLNRKHDEIKKLRK